MVTLWRAATGNGSLPARGLGRLFLAALASLGRLPFGAVETALARRRLTQSPEPSPPPIFIVGHWRSGTTHLCNLLSLDPCFDYASPMDVGLPWEILGLTKWLSRPLRAALPDGRFIDNVAVTPDSLQEDEIAIASMTTLSFYHGIYFPRRFAETIARGIFFDGCGGDEIAEWRDRFLLFNGKIASRRPGATLLVKNPVYTARIALLREMWPNARFIHIHRNPHIVFASTCRFYERLIEALALQDAKAPPIREVVLSTYDRMMERLKVDVEDLPDSQFVEVRYEDLEDSPLRVLEQIYDQLGLTGFQESEAAFRSYLRSLGPYVKNSYTFPEAAMVEVEERWATHLACWGYGRPGTVGS